MKYQNLRNKIQKKSLGGVIEIAELIGSFIPGASEIIDLYGLARGLITGNTLDTMLSAAGLFTPAISGKQLKTAKKLLIDHSDEIAGAVRKVQKDGNIMDGPLNKLISRVKNEELKDSKSKIGSKAFKELNIDARNLTAPQKGFSFDERGILVDKYGEPAVRNPDFRGYDIDQIREQLEKILSPERGGKYTSLKRLSEEKNSQATRYLKSAKDLQDQLRNGNIKDLPKFQIRYGGTPNAEHIITAKSFGYGPDIFLGSGYHAESPYIPGIDKRTSLSQNMSFAGDTRKAVVGYHSADPKQVEELIKEKLKGIEKLEVEDAFEFTKIFDKKYGIKENLSKTLPPAAYKDPQIDDYIKAREIISLALGQQPRTGKFVPVVYRAPEIKETVIVDGKGIAAWDDLSRGEIKFGINTYRPEIQFQQLASTRVPSLDIVIGKDSHIKAMRLDNVWNRPLMQTVGLKGGLLQGMKHGGNIIKN